MENKNSVAYIDKITKILPIENADKIEQCFVNGWSSVTHKGIHKENDLVLCVTQDAVIPNKLATKWNIINYLKNNSRVKTIKLKGVFSECILIPVSDVYKVGDDMMSDLGIFKYESPVKIINIPGNSARKIRWQDNQNFHIYYKFPNQKNTPDMFNENDTVVITRKIHGTNGRWSIIKKSKTSILDKIKLFMSKNLFNFVPYNWKYSNYEYSYGSHNVQKGSDSQGFYSTDVWQEIADKYNLKDRLFKLVKEFTLEELGSGFILYGEIYGDNIQSKEYNYGLHFKELATFDISLNGKYLSNEEFEFLNDLLGTKSVPYLYYGKWSKEEQDKYIGGFIHDTKVPHEGIVVKCITGSRHKISKCINPDYHIFNDKNNIEDLEAH